jgi:hypothetical protein
MVRRKFIIHVLDEESVTIIPNRVDTSLIYPTPLPKESFSALLWYVPDTLSPAIAGGY